MCKTRKIRFFLKDEWQGDLYKALKKPSRQIGFNKLDRFIHFAKTDEDVNLVLLALQLKKQNGITQTALQANFIKLLYVLNKTDMALDILKTEVGGFY
jgi:adenylosuccinate lyase